jgi:hypothetical protein
VAKLGGMGGQVGRDWGLSWEGWVAKLVGMYSMALESRHPSKIINVRHKQMTGQNSVARQIKIQKYISMNAKEHSFKVFQKYCNLSKKMCTSLG